MLLSSHYFVVFVCFPLQKEKKGRKKTFFASVAVSPDTLKFHHWRREALEGTFSFLCFCARPETHKDSQWDGERMKHEPNEWMGFYGHNSRLVASIFVLLETSKWTRNCHNAAIYNQQNVQPPWTLIQKLLALILWSSADQQHENQAVHDAHKRSCFTLFSYRKLQQNERQREQVLIVLLIRP